MNIVQANPMEAVGEPYKELKFQVNEKFYNEALAYFQKQQDESNICTPEETLHTGMHGAIINWLGLFVSSHRCLLA